MNDAGDTVIGILSAFRPTAEVVENCAAVLPQVTSLIVVDDGSGPEFNGLFSSLRELGCAVIENHANVGIAAALNVGVAKARAANADFVLTLDQDSSVPESYVNHLVDEYIAATKAGIAVGMVAPWKISGRPSTKAYTERHGFTLGSEPIQSGQVIPMSTFDRVGPFAEDFFIDGVDADFYLRSKRIGLSSVFCRHVDLGHAMGIAGKAQLFGRQIMRGSKARVLRYHPPWRNYYIFRNGLVLLARYGLVDGSFLRSYLIGMSKRFLITMLFTPNKSTQFAAISRGLWHAVSRRSGKLPAKLHERWSLSASDNE